MALGVILWKEKSVLENPCSCGIALGDGVEAGGGKPPRSKDLHLVSLL